LHHLPLTATLIIVGIFILQRFLGTGRHDKVRKP
jgi:hypothetical protein